MTTWRQGLWRQPFHFAGWAIWIYSWGYLIHGTYSTPWVTYLLISLIALATAYAIYDKEREDFREHRQDNGKTIHDLIFKFGGLVVGLATMHRWWA